MESKKCPFNGLCECKQEECALWCDDMLECSLHDVNNKIDELISIVEDDLREQINEKFNDLSEQLESIWEKIE